jgi:hypothetical protein
MSIWLQPTQTAIPSNRINLIVERRIYGAALVFALALSFHLGHLAMLPPGLDRDAAANGWLALKWLRYGIVPFWVSHASAPEPLMIWLQGATTWAFGPSVTSLRVVSAAAMALAAAVAYLLAWEVERYSQPAVRRWSALLAGIILACNPLATELARTGLRATLLPALSGLMFLALLAALRTRRLHLFALAGLLLGLSAYTYLAARFLPVVLLVFAGMWVLFGQSSEGVEKDERTHRSVAVDGQQRRNSTSRAVNIRAPLWMGTTVMAAVALVIVTPQLWFFVRYPQAFWERAQAVTLWQNPLADEVGALGVMARKAAGLLMMFGIQWSGQYNQGARPLLQPLALAGFVAAWPLLWRRRREPAALLLAAALAVMLLPDLLGGDRLQPHELRVIGAMVPAVVFAGIGLAHLLAWTAQRLPRVRLGVLAAGAALLLAGWSTLDWYGIIAPRLLRSDYSWYARPEAALADFLVQTQTPVLAPLNEYSRSVVAYLAAGRAARVQSGLDAEGQPRWRAPAQVDLFWPANPERGRVESSSYLFDPAALVLVEGDQAWLMPPAQADVAQLWQECAARPLATPSGQPAGELCSLAWDALRFPQTAVEPRWSVERSVDETLRLLGVDADTTLLEGDGPLAVTSYWQATAPTMTSWRYFVHLLDDRQQLVAGEDLMPGYGLYTTDLWQRDEVIALRQLLRLPAELTPGRYWLELGLYHPLSGERAIVTSETGEIANRVVVGPLKVALLEAKNRPADETQLSARLGDELAFSGAQLETSAAHVRVMLRVEALAQPARDYTFFIHVEGPDGNVAAQMDMQPLGGQYPTGIWDPGEQVLLALTAALPPGLAPGEYPVWAGAYDASSGERLRLSAPGQRVEADRLWIGTATIQ